MIQKHPFTSFNISKLDFDKQSIEDIEGNLWGKSIWPIVYILSSKKQKLAYIGETTHAKSRLLTHIQHSQKGKLDTLHLISSDLFNKSATLDIEASLISYFGGDGNYTLLNGNAGIANHNYYQRDEYRELFKLIWTRLKKENDLTLKSLKEIDNSDLFKYSPYKKLSYEQYGSIIEILEVLTSGSFSSIVVNGSAGTGKTVLAIFLMKLLASRGTELWEEDYMNENYEENMLVSLKEKFQNPEIALVVPMTSLRKTLKKVFGNVNGLKSSMVIGPSDVAKKRYDILLIDEAHRLARRKNIPNFASFDQTNAKLGFEKEAGTQLDWVIKQSEHQIFFYDPAQSVKPSDIEKACFDKLAKTSKRIKLHSQMRVKGGADYISHVDKLLNTAFQKHEEVFAGDQYELVLFDSIHDLQSQLNQKEAEMGLCRMIAGYSWEWKSKKDQLLDDITIEGKGFKWNSTNQEWVNSKNAIHEIGCIHTTQGYDLNYTGIIFGHEIGYNAETDEIVILKENYFDRNGKAGIKDPSTLKSYIINIYKTLMYRGIQGTYVYVCNPDLRKYFKNYIPIFEAPGAVKTLPQAEVIPFKNAVPFYNIEVAAGDFSELQIPDQTEWLKLPDTYHIDEDFFACKVVGESMNKKIPNGSICLFRRDRGGSRNGKTVLVQHTSFKEEDFGAGFTVKEYYSKKVQLENSWHHHQIVLKAKSTDPNFEDIILENDTLEEFRVLGEFVCVVNF
ncbi:MAG: DNA/RNA helicase domain-containing protein [Bacteroidia bacterium]